MAWIESHQTLMNHPKTRKAARLLDVQRVQVIGHLQALWWWALDYAQDGDVTDFDPADIADAVEWLGEPDVLIQALLDCGTGGKHGFLERTGEGRLVIHDWDDYTGKLIDKRKRDAERKRSERRPLDAAAPSTIEEMDQTEDRALSNGHPTDIPCPSQVPYPTVPNRTQPTEPTEEAAPAAVRGSPWALVEDFCEIVGMDPSDMGGERGKQAKTAKSLLSRHPRDDILRCARWLWSQDFWRNQGIDLITVGNQMTKWAAAGRPASVAARAAPANQRETVTHTPRYWKPLPED